MLTFLCPKDANVPITVYWHTEEKVSELNLQKQTDRREIYLASIPPSLSKHQDYAVCVEKSQSWLSRLTKPTVLINKRLCSEDLLKRGLLKIGELPGLAGSVGNIYLHGNDGKRYGPLRCKGKLMFVFLMKLLQVFLTLELLMTTTPSNQLAQECFLLPLPSPFLPSLSGSSQQFPIEIPIWRRSKKPMQKGYHVALLSNTLHLKAANAEVYIIYTNVYLLGWHTLWSAMENTNIWAIFLEHAHH